jgi:hypothetical protein
VLLHFSEYVAKGLCSHTAGLSEFSKSERSRSFRESIEDCLSRHRARRFRCGRVVEDTKREMVVGSLKDHPCFPLNYSSNKGNEYERLFGVWLSASQK